MRRTARLLFAGILLLLVPHFGLATTPIVLANPGFESGVSPWHICGGAPMSMRSSPGPTTSTAGATRSIL